MDNGGLAEDALIVILISLPVKSLVRFKCVSKYWYALIKSPNFITTHLKRDCKNETVLIKCKPPRGKSDDLCFHYLDFTELSSSPTISSPILDNLSGKKCYGSFDTCNGVVCLAFYEYRPHRNRPIFKVRDRTSMDIVLCNPALRESKLLDPTPFACPLGYVAHILEWGFGFDANTNAYKVVELWDIISMDDDDHKDSWIRVDLYDSSTNSWRLIDAWVPRVFRNTDFHLFFNGACHWITNTNCILSFDLSTEVFQQFEYPDFGDDSISYLLVFNQCIAIVHIQRLTDYWDYVYDFWVMKEYGVKESWTKEFRLRPYEICCPMLFLKNERLLVATFSLKLAIYTLRDNEIKGISSNGSVIDNDYVRAVIFKESLICLK